jgi:hypothetical protein
MKGSRKNSLGIISKKIYGPYLMGCVFWGNKWKFQEKIIWSLHKIKKLKTVKGKVFYKNVFISLFKIDLTPFSGICWARKRSQSSSFRISLTPIIGYLVVQHSFFYACILFTFAGVTDLVGFPLKIFVNFFNFLR